MGKKTNGQENKQVSKTKCHVKWGVRGVW